MNSINFYDFKDPRHPGSIMGSTKHRERSSPASAFSTNTEARRVDKILDPLHFNLLFERAEQLLSSKHIPPAEEDPSTLTTEQKVVAQLGTFSLRIASELHFNTSSEALGHHDEAITLTSTLQGPEAYSTPLDREAILRAEQFGEQLMDDMFTVLGNDAPEKAYQLKNGTTQEQIEALLWLDNRLQTIAHTYDHTDDSTEIPTYHPVRLSGKIIGKYPHTRISPSCLGVSIAAAGFVKKAGLDFLHAGVMQTANTEAIQMSRHLFKEAPAIIEERFSTTLHPVFTAFTEKFAQDATVALNTDLGYHDCLYVKLDGLTWMQIDPNLDTTGVIKGQILTEGFNQKLHYLKELKAIAPGLELSHEVGSSNNVDITLEKLKLLIEGISDEHLAPREVIQHELLSLHPEDSALVQEIYQKAIYSTLERFQDAIDEDCTINKENIVPLNTIYENGNTSGYESFSLLFEKIALETLSPSEYIARCHKDPYFLERAVEDIRTLPLYILTLSSIEREAFVHASVEVGLPATRIGLSALHEVSLFEDVSPHGSFWLSQWPSHVPVTEAFHTEEARPSQRSIRNNRALLAYVHPYNLTYSIFHSKMMHTLSNDLRSDYGDSQTEEV